MEEVEYTVIVKSDSKGGYWTQVPALPGCGSQGETMAEAVEMTKEAISSYLGSLRKHGAPELKEHSIVVKVTVAV